MKGRSGARWASAPSTKKWGSRYLLQRSSDGVVCQGGFLTRLKQAVCFLELKAGGDDGVFLFAFG